MVVGRAAIFYLIDATPFYFAMDERRLLVYTVHTMRNECR